MIADIALTPAEELFVEVLIARHRLGEGWWVFSTSQRRTANSLERKGLVILHSPHVERTFRAELSELGKSLYMSKPYVSPAQLMTPQEALKLIERSLFK